MKIAIGYPPFESAKGQPTLGQNRQFEWFGNPSYVYPMVPAMAATMLARRGHDVRWMDGVAEEWSYAEFRARIERDAVVVSVEDNGIGIPKRELDRLGQPFVQVENQFTKTHQGSGLGLAIARSLTELHHGKMEIQSEVGVGTTVTVRLPREGDARAAA